MPHIDRFVLPRPDWYDEDGRIYKDALIENFNALEAKYNEVLKLTPFTVDEPDWANLELDDVTLESDDERVVNLKSFVEIMKLIDFPIEIVFDGTKCVRLRYYNDEYKLKQITNTTITGLDNTNRYIYLNSTDNQLYCSSELITTDVLIGVYNNGKVFTLLDKTPCDINALSLLAKMGIEYASFSFPNDEWGRSQTGYNMYGRGRVKQRLMTGAGGGNAGNIYDMGRKGSADRS